MSIGFYSCDCCGESRYKEYVGICSKCGHSLCTSCLVNDDIDSKYARKYNVKFNGSKEQKEKYDIKSKEESKYGYDIGEVINDVGIDSKYCPFCSGDEIHNDDLLEFALKLLNTDRNILIARYKDTNK